MSLNSQNQYEIKIHGRLDESWLGWFGEAKVQAEVSDFDIQITTFSNVIMDQTGLVGLIRRLHGGRNKKEKTMYKNITKIALKGIAMAMGIAVIVLSTLKTLDVNSGIFMLGMGLAALALANFQE